MKILLINSEDHPEKGPWTNVIWDRIVDLGMGGANTYARCMGRFGCPVTTLNSLRNGFDDFWRVREGLGLGCGWMIDEHGLDWWEIMSIEMIEEMETLIVLQRFVRTISAGDEVHVSRPGIHASVLHSLLPGRVQVFLCVAAQRRGDLGTIGGFPVSSLRHR